MTTALRVPQSAQTDAEARIYLIEDDPAILQFVQRAMLSRPDWRLVGFSDSRSHARRHALNETANVYLVDLGLPDGRGEELLRWLGDARPDVELLVFTVFGDESRLVAALEAGAAQGQ